MQARLPLPLPAWSLTCPDRRRRMEQRPQGVAGLLAFAFFQRLQAAIIAGALLVTGLALLLLPAARIRRGLRRRPEPHARRRSGGSRMAGQPARTRARLPAMSAALLQRQLRTAAPG